MSIASMARFGVYAPAAFGWAACDPMADRSLLVPLTHSGVEFAGRVHRDVHGLFTALLDELVPLIPGGLMTPGCWGFSASSVTVGGSRSFHTYGVAIDLNAPANPMYARARPTGAHALPPAASAVARKYGCEWGGDWSYPQDWMHIECHLPPDVARTIQPTPKPAPVPPEEDDMKITITTHPTTGAKRAFVLGPKGYAEITRTEKNGNAPEVQARALAAVWGVTIIETSEVNVTVGIAGSAADGKAF